eukprot:3650353-Rhodomonas_salina.1
MRCTVLRQRARGQLRCGGQGRTGEKPVICASCAVLRHVRYCKSVLYCEMYCAVLRESVLYCAVLRDVRYCKSVCVVWARCAVTYALRGARCPVQYCANSLPMRYAVLR